jgi:TonB-dependent receptor
MLEFKDSVNNLPVRGNVGLRYVNTNQVVSGQGTVKVGTTTEYVDWTKQNTYHDVLPSFNLAMTPSKDVIVRLAAAKVMARPGLSQLNPATSSSTATGTGYVTVKSGNPFLEPYRANTVDTGVEYYFDKNAMIGVGLFQKNIGSYVQTLVTQTTWAEAGLDPAIAGSTNANDKIDVSRPINTPGGKLQGIELNYQQPFNFLPGIGKNFGSLLSYTYVDVAIDRAKRTATLTVSAPKAAVPSTIEAIQQAGDSWYPLQMARELDDAILCLRSNELDIGTWLLKTTGDAALALQSVLDFHHSRSAFALQFH